MKRVRSVKAAARAADVAATVAEAVVVDAAVTAEVVVAAVAEDAAAVTVVAAVAAAAIANSFHKISFSQSGRAHLARPFLFSYKNQRAQNP